MSNAIVLTNVRILDGSGKAPFSGEVRVQGNRIQDVYAIEGGQGEQRNTGDAEFIDAGGATLMPGLVESHGHVSFGDTSTLEALGDIPPEEHTLLSMKNAKKMLFGDPGLPQTPSHRHRVSGRVKRPITSGYDPRIGIRYQAVP